MSELVAELDDALLADYALRVYAAESTGQPPLSVANWDAILGALRLEVERRPALGALSVELAWRQGAARIAGRDYAGARDLLSVALQRAGAGSPWRGWILASLAQLDSAEERWTDCRDHLRSAEGEWVAVSNAGAFRPWIEGLRGELWLGIGMPELAAEWVDRQWAAGSRSSDSNERWTAIDLRLKYLLVANDYAALDELERHVLADPWYASLGPSARAKVDYLFAFALVEQGPAAPERNRQARNRLAAVLGPGLLDPTDSAGALYGLALAELDAGQIDAAVASVERMHAILEALGALDPSRPENTLATQLIALESLITCSRAQAGQVPAEATLAALARAQAAWRRVRARWSEVPTRDGGIGYLFLSNRQLLVEGLLGLGLQALGGDAGAQAALEWLIEAQLESTLAQRMDLQACSLAEARATLLSSTRGLVAWVPLRGRSYALAVDGTRARAFALPGVDVLDARARELVALVQAAIQGGGADGHAKLEAALEAAGQVFLPSGLEAFLEPWDSLYLVGLDDCGYVPFELFDAGAGATQGSRRAICRLPSIPVGVDLVARASARAPLAPHARLVIADEPDGALAGTYGVEPLAVPADLLEGFTDSLAGLTVSVAAGSAADASSLRADARLPGGMLHVVGHGIRRVDERPPGILLAAGAGRTGAVFAEDVEALVAPELVLLSVCGAGRSRLRRGDGARSDLSASFFLSGALAVASSSADLDLQPTLRSGARVHASLLAGDSLAEALRTARHGFVLEGGRFGRESLAAHLLQASGAGLTVRLEPVSGSAPSIRRPGPLALAVTGGTLLAALAGLLLFAFRRRGPASRQ